MEETMKLPPGKTCGDCFHAKRCEWLIGGRFQSINIECDWSPSRFAAARQPAPQEREEHDG